MDNKIPDYKSMDDNTLLCSFTIPGQPATKKNSQRIIRVGKFLKVIPSKQFLAYQDHCETYCKKAWTDQGKEPMDYGVAIYFQCWLQKWQIPDHVGIMQSVGDILQHWGVLADDKYIHWSDTELDKKDFKREHWIQGIDKENPRIEFKIYRFRHPIEQYQEDKDLKDSLKTPRKKLSPKTSNKNKDEKLITKRKTRKPRVVRKQT